MSQIIPIFIPTYINSAEYTPARVLPRLFFYNGLVECERYWIESGSAAFGGVTFAQTAFPYFDNYNVVTGSFPTTGSKSLLFNNEQAVYGTMPNENLYTEYWETYINLLYNPKTRLLTCSAIIPLADYFTMELNDIVNFRGNYYHLRAINDYSLKTGECTLQLLGPIIPDTFYVAPTPPPEDANVRIHLSEYNASPTAFFDANLFVDGTPYFFSGNFTQSIAGGTTGDVTMELKDGGSTIWGPYTTASAQFSIYENTTLLQSASLIVRSGSGDVDLTFPITFTAGQTFTISGSTQPFGTTTTTTTTSTTTTTTTLAPDCREYSLTNNSSVTIFWGATLCNGSGTGGSIPGSGAVRYTDCIIPGTITASGTLTITEIADCSPAPTVYSYTGCGRGSNVSSTCSDAANNRTFYSDCDILDFGVGCYVYVDTFPNPLTGYNNVFMNGATWDINSSTGEITALSSEQC